MTITFVIPTYNASEYLENCLQSIRNQTQPAEIIVVDGGSTDNTVDIALKYKCEVMYNPLKLAEFGLKQGILATTTDLVAVFAADNKLASEGFVAQIKAIFKNSYPLIHAAWGKLSGDEKPINQYFELIQNDPMCWFINNNLKKYINSSAGLSTAFFINPKKPLVWGANGLVYRTREIKPFFKKHGYIGDNDAFQALIEDGKNRVVYVHEDYVVHFHCKNIKHCVSKWWRNHIQHYLAHKTERNMRWIMDKWFFLKLILWIIYVPLFSLPHSIYMAIRDKNKAWLYHYPLSMCQLIIYILAKLGIR